VQHSNFIFLLVLIIGHSEQVLNVNISIFSIF